MKKILIIGCVLMGTYLSAMSLPDNVSIVKHEKTEFVESLSFNQANFLNEVDFAIVEDVSAISSDVKDANFAHVTDINVVDRIGFYKPIEYESFNTNISTAEYNLSKVEESIQKKLLSFK